MRVGILPVAVLVALAVVALAVVALGAWALLSAIKGRPAKARFPPRHAVVVMACGTVLWLGVSFFFMVLASLGHSPHPLRDSWVQCLLSLVVFEGVPGAVLIWLARHRKRS